MKKLLFLFLVIPFLFAASPLQQKHLAVIAALNNDSGYSFTYVDSCSNSTEASGTTLDCTTTLDIVAGDTLIAWSTWYGASTSTGVAEDDDSQPFAMETTLANGSTKGAIGIIAEAATGTGATIRQTIGTASTYRSIIVYQFRKTGGTASKDTYASGTGSSTAPLTGTFSTTAGAVVMAGEFDGSMETDSNPLIAGSAADASIIQTSNPKAAGWYSILESSGTDITASSTLAGSGTWVCGAIAVKAE